MRLAAAVMSWVGRDRTCLESGAAVAEEDLIVLVTDIDEPQIDLCRQTGEMTALGVDVPGADAQQQLSARVVFEQAGTRGSGLTGRR